MKGDFSKWRFDPKRNLNGVLHQQGRVFTDRDGTDQTRIAMHWQDQAARDAFGASVAAVPASGADSFKVQGAFVNADSRVVLELSPGRVWADGLLAYLPQDESDPLADVSRVASYFEPPLQTPERDSSSIAAGVRDAVVLELWHEAFNAFQDPLDLIEPALGGPDTTERVHTAVRFRLYRLAVGESCDSIKNRLIDDPVQKGKLEVTLQPTNIIAGDCPVVEGGGYVGFEHLLYRIEMARVDAAQAMFKWSQFNGGLVGRGECDLAGPNRKITLAANDQAIKMSGLTDFYLEVVEADIEHGHWRVTYGTEVTLNGDDLEVTTEHYVEAPRPTGTVFFRLWNGILPITNFPKVAAPAEPNELRDGIRLAFDAPTGSNYRPDDYWTFEVRAGDIANPDPLIADEPPQGIEYHRVPLAVLHWDADLNIRFDTGEINDCRDVFRPLTNRGVCCSYTVGDGISSHGDFDSIEEALRHLPASGGEICLLPGVHEANLRIENRKNIKVKGCDKHTKVIPRRDNRDTPIFEIIDSSCIILEHMDLATLTATAVLMRGTEFGVLNDIEVHHNRILAFDNAIHALNATNLNLHHNTIRMLDKEGAGVAIFALAEDSFIERNDIGVVPAENLPPPNDGGDDDVPTDPSDPCADPESAYSNRPYLIAYLEHVWTFLLTFVFIPAAPFRALGGIQVAGGSERVKVLENVVQGGAGNGVTLGGTVSPLDDDTDEEDHILDNHGATIHGSVETDDAQGLSGITVTLRSDANMLNDETDEDGRFRIPAALGSYAVALSSLVYAIDEIRTENLGEFGQFHRIKVVERETDFGDLIAFLYHITIEGNTIHHMGLSGVGIPVVDPDSIQDTSRLAALERFLARLGNPVVSLRIVDNYISNCLRNPFTQALRSVAQQRGLGGISLGLCGDLVVYLNRIENNGTSYLTPVCGLYLTYGEEVDITHNYIVNNGPLVEEGDADPIPGKRGGIVVAATALAVLDLLQGERDALTTPRPAVRVHDNIVDQPAGQALRIFALGPLSVLNNQFNSERSGASTLERLIGAVLILNLGGLNTAGVLSSDRASFTRAATSHLPGGNTLFNNNQTRLGRSNESIAAQFILTFDDLGFDSNQSDMLSPGLPLMDNVRFAINTLLGGVTLRAGDNRFKEPIDPERSFKLSLYSRSTLLNTTTDNQGNHCIIALSDNGARPAVSAHNQVIDTTLCEQRDATLSAPFGSQAVMFMTGSSYDRRS